MWKYVSWQYFLKLKGKEQSFQSLHADKVCVSQHCKDECSFQCANLIGSPFAKWFPVLYW